MYLTDAPGRTWYDQGMAYYAILPLVLLLLVVALLVASSRYMRRKGYSGVGGETIVRCRDGHLFTTIWVPGASFKSVRLGWMRYQHCPVGNHWTFVVPVSEAELTEAEKRFAAEHHDVNIP